MKTLTFIILFFVFYISALAQKEKESKLQSTDTLIVETACGQCQFGMKSKKGCDLAIKIEDKPFFVDGTSIDDHGDAHAKDGFCNAIRKAKVTGKIKRGRFIATSFQLLP